MPRRVSPHDLIALTGIGRRPLVVDVRRPPAFEESGRRIAGSISRDHMAVDRWLPELPHDLQVVVYCAHGHNVSEIAAAELAAAGADVALLHGGFSAYVEAGGPTVANEGEGVDVTGPGSAWVTRERPKIDRIACPWLIRRFIDPLAQFRFVAAEWVRDVAEETGATPFDVEGVRYSHRGDGCTFDALIEDFHIDDLPLSHLAAIVRGADTARPDLAPQASGLLALSLGLSAIESDDLAQLETGMIFYDALYGWCRHAREQTHNWPAKSA